MAKDKSNGAVDGLTVEGIRTAFDRRTSRVHPVADLGRLAIDAGWGSRPFGPWSLQMLPYTTRFAHGTITFVDGRSLAMTFTRGPLELLPTNLVGDIMLSHGEGQRWIDLSAQVRVRADGQVFAIRTRQDMDQLVVMHRNFAMLWAEAISEAQAIREGMAAPMERELVCNDCRVPAMRPGANGVPLADHDLASFGVGGATGGLGSGLPGLMAGLDEKLAEGTAGTSGPGLDTGSLSLADWAAERSTGGAPRGGRGMVSQETGKPHGSSAGANDDESFEAKVKAYGGAAAAVFGLVGQSVSRAAAVNAGAAAFVAPTAPFILATGAFIAVGVAVYLIYKAEKADPSFVEDDASESSGTGEAPTGGDQSQPQPSEDKSQTETKSSDDNTSDDQTATDTSETPENKPGEGTTGIPIDEQAQWDGPESLSMQSLKAFAAFYFALKMNAKAGELVQYGEGDGFDPGGFPEPFRVAPNDDNKKAISAAELKKLTDQIIRRRRQKLGELIQ